MPSSPLVVSVGATRIGSKIAELGDAEDHAPFSDRDHKAETDPQGAAVSRVSVVAPGANVVVMGAAGRNAALAIVQTPRPWRTGGTSIAAPFVSGIIAQMILVDRTLEPLPNRRTDTLMGRALRIVEMLEATADSAFKPASPRTNTRLQAISDKPGLFGHGRVNAWKAILAISNRGVAHSKGNHFTSLANRVVLDGATRWYGFEIRSTRRLASVSLENPPVPPAPPVRVQVTDVNNGFMPGAVGASALAYKGIQVPGRTLLSARQKQRLAPLPEPRVPVGAPTGADPPNGQFVVSFSIFRNDLMLTPAGVFRDHLLVRDGAGNVIYRVDLARFRAAGPFRGTGGEPLRLRGVSFDDFVFTIDVDRAIDNGVALAD